MARTKGAKGKKTLEYEEKQRAYEAFVTKTKRGRPAGSKNKITKPKKTFTQYIDEVKDLSTSTNGYNDERSYDNIEIINCTGHHVTIRGGESIAPHTYLRVSENSYIKGYINGTPVFDVSYTAGLLPDKSPNKIYVVGQPVCIAAPDRDDLYMPHKVNHIDKSCLGIVQNPFYKALLKKEAKE